MVELFSEWDRVTWWIIGASFKVGAIVLLASIVWDWLKDWGT